MWDVGCGRWESEIAEWGLCFVNENEMKILAVHMPSPRLQYVSTILDLERASSAGTH